MPVTHIPLAPQPLVSCFGVSKEHVHESKHRNHSPSHHQASRSPALNLRAQLSHSSTTVVSGSSFSGPGKTAEIFLRAAALQRNPEVLVFPTWSPVYLLERHSMSTHSVQFRWWRKQRKSTHTNAHTPKRKSGRTRKVGEEQVKGEYERKVSWK